jgi:hypothetical protein
MNNNVVKARFKRSGNLYISNATTARKSVPTVLAAHRLEPIRKANYHIWHYRLAHLHLGALKQLSNKEAVHGLATEGTCPSSCEDCPFGKNHHAPFYISPFRASKPLDIVYGDLMGPFDTSLGGSRYVFTLFDGFSRYLWVFFLKGKSATEVFDEFTGWLARAENQTGLKLLTLSTDGGGEFVNNTLGPFLKSRGIIHRITTPYTPEQNGKVERQNRVLVEADLTMRHAAGLGMEFWAESMATVAHVRNRVPSSRNPDTTPYELFFKAKPSVAHLRVFGCRAWVLIPDEVRRKGQFRSLDCIFVGYYEDSRAWKFYLKEWRAFIKSRDTIFDEEGVNG